MDSSATHTRKLMDLVLFEVPSKIFDPAPDYQLSEREAGH